MKLKDIKATEFKKDQKYDFLFPIGATEQHGPFLPFGTDTYIGDYLVEQVEKEFPEIIILPTLEYSRSQEHRGFYGTLYLTEETLEKVMFDICNSLKNQAKNIFIYSFHANSVYINKFIKKYSFENTKIININESNDEDYEYIEKNILHGPLDGHAGNSEIANMLVIDENLVELPPKEYPKIHIENHFETDNLIERSLNGIADNHPEWITNKKIGQDILNVYIKRIIENFRKHLGK
jgi:creatinine amidohydrolase/Fe(II)-dependent formamide hydrolase-like protein